MDFLYNNLIYFIPVLGFIGIIFMIGKSTWVTKQETGDAAMTEKAEHNRNRKNDPARDVGRAAVASAAADRRNHERQCGARQHHATGVDAQASEPFPEVIALGLEHEPLISQEGKADAQEIGKKTGEDVSVSDHRTQQRREQGIAAISKRRVARAHYQVAHQLWAARHGQGCGGHGQLNPVCERWRAWMELLSCE